MTPVMLGPTGSAFFSGCSPCPMAFTGTSRLYPNAITSPFPEKCLPSSPESGSPAARERRRISVLPSEPAARMT